MRKGLSLGKLLLFTAVPWVLFKALRRVTPIAAKFLLVAATRRVVRSLLSNRGGKLAAAEVREKPAAAQSAPQPDPAATGLTSFTKALLWLGILLAVMVAGDLVVRGFQREIPPPVWELSQEETNQGHDAIVRHGCGGCHIIPGIRHATGRVGPQLGGLRNQMYVAGVLPNIPENLIRWIRDPQAVNPKTAMPNLEVSAEDAREMATYLYTQP
jgi:cytochrome c